MKIVKSEQVKEIDAYTIKKEPIASIDLMERAAQTITDWLKEQFSTRQKFHIAVGPGNNGGDGLAIARQLSEYGFNVEVLMIRISDKISPDAQINYERLISNGKVKITDIEDKSQLPVISDEVIIVDAMFGSGLTRKLKGLPAEVVHWMNNSVAKVVAVDIPSGLFGEDNGENDYSAIVNANHTLTFQFPNLSFLFAENETKVGDWHVMDIGLHPQIIKETNTSYYLVDESDELLQLKCRGKFSHKGNYGHALLFSGSYGKMGAAVLASKACLRAGCGLLTAHIPKLGYTIMQSSVPEAMLSIDWSEIIITTLPDLASYDAIGVGPGIGTKQNTKKGLKAIIDNCEVPLVIDADGINILGMEKEWLHDLPENTILTPHPKEFERIAGLSGNSFERLKLQKEVSARYSIYIVLKGAYTTVSTPDGKCYFNSTGNPSMATAGSGDVLTGIILSLLSQGYSPEKASVIGAYVHGKAGDIAFEKLGYESVIASDIIENLGQAFQILRK